MLQNCIYIYIYIYLYLYRCMHVDDINALPGMEAKRQEHIAAMHHKPTEAHVCSMRCVPVGFISIVGLPVRTRVNFGPATHKNYIAPSIF